MAEGCSYEQFRDAMGDVTGAQFNEALTILEQQANLANEISTIGKKHRMKRTETVASLLERTTEKGDADAARLIAAGVLDRRIYLPC
jgi:hypothetical protein